MAPKKQQRAKPGTTGRGKYYRIIVRPKEDFVSFRIQDIGRKGHTQRLAGRRSSGSWDTQAWLISKEDARLKDGKLVSKSASVKKLISTLGTVPIYVKGDIFKARDRKNIPEKEPTMAKRWVQTKNIKKRQIAR